jgi:hypothetical protein
MSAVSVHSVERCRQTEFRTKWPFAWKRIGETERLLSGFSGSWLCIAWFANGMLVAVYLYLRARGVSPCQRIVSVVLTGRTVINVV